MQVFPKAKKERSPFFGLFFFLQETNSTHPWNLKGLKIPVAEVMLECTHKVKTPFPVSDGWLCCMATRMMDALMSDQTEMFCKPEAWPMPGAKSPPPPFLKEMNLNPRNWCPRTRG